MMEFKQQFIVTNVYEAIIYEQTFPVEHRKTNELNQTYKYAKQKCLLNNSNDLPNIAMSMKIQRI